MKFIFAALLLVTVAFAQEGEGKPKLPKQNVKGVNETSPVTQSEASAVFVRARNVINVARIAKIPTKTKLGSSNQLITRDMVILEMARLLKESEPAIKLVPRPVVFNATLLKAGSPGSKSALLKLVKWGFVAPVGPLATGPTANLTPREFGDAVGFFLARLTDVTHMPSIKWSPYLQSDH
jgi:hypothetical protein